MTLTLAVRGMERLDNGESGRLTLDRHGARIGRSPHADWSLPDPNNYVSSTHCEVDYRGGAYVLVDKSTNGTFVNGSPERLTRPHVLAEGDVIHVGHYEIEASFAGGAGAKAAAPAAPQPAATPGWNAWGDAQPAAPISDWGGVSAPVPQPSAGWASTPAPQAAIGGGWDAPAPQAAISGLGAMSGAWSAPSVAPPPAAPSAWDMPQAAAAPASDWSSPVSAASGPPAAVDVWGELTSSVGVDWSRGGFGAPEPDRFGLNGRAAAPAPDQVLGLSGGEGVPAAWGSPKPAPPPAPTTDWGAPATPHPPPPSFGVPVSPAAPPSRTGGEWAGFLGAAGLNAQDLKAPPAEALAAAGGLLKRLVAGLVVMLEARARAKAQLGAQGTSLEFAGNNPLKFARSPDRALAQMLNPAERGFMDPYTAVEDAFCDLQAHQVATLSAMQGALASTLARFSPTAIRGRAEMRGVLAKILPSARDATLWQAYEREFEGVAKGSDEAFMEVFAKEFRTAYERVAAEMKHTPGRS